MFLLMRVITFCHHELPRFDTFSHKLSIVTSTLSPIIKRNTIKYGKKPYFTLNHIQND
jgi:hypothetical protein